MTFLYRHNRFPFKEELTVFHILHTILIGQVVYLLYHLVSDVQNRPLIRMYTSTAPQRHKLIQTHLIFRSKSDGSHAPECHIDFRVFVHLVIFPKIKLEMFCIGRPSPQNQPGWARMWMYVICGRENVQPVYFVFDHSVNHDSWHPFIRVVQIWRRTTATLFNGTYTAFDVTYMLTTINNLHMYRSYCLYNIL